MSSTSLRPAGPAILRRLQWLMIGRLVVATILLGGILLLSFEDAAGGASFTPRFLQALIAATYGASLLFALWLLRARDLVAVARVQIGWDLIVTTGLMAVSGGAASGFTFLYGINILMAAIVLGGPAVTGTTVTALLLYTAVGISLANGWCPSPPDQLETHYRMPATELGTAVLGNLTGLILVGLLAGNLSSRLRKTGGELRRAERSAASLARLNDDIVRSIATGLVTTDLEGRVQTINPAAADMFGTPPESLLGLELDRLMPVGAAPGDGGASAVVSRAETTATRPDGSTFLVGYTRTPLVEPDGQVIGTLVAFQDLTEVRELRRAAERSERLATLGRLAAGLAHEIRNPLSSISGSVELVRDGSGLQDEDRRLLDIVRAEVERLDDLVTTMLQVGRPTAPQRRAVRLTEVANEVVDMACRGPGAAAGVEIELEAPSEDVMVHADPDQIRQVLWNLLKNAIQASDPRTHVTVRLRHDDGAAEMEVSDRGRGIPAEELEKLFDMFYSGRPQGVGLGLALVKQIVDAHGGQVHVEPRDGGGTRFAVRLPAVPSHQTG